MAPRGCNHSPDEFCYICGQFINTRAKFSVTTSRKMCEACKAYFGAPVGDPDKTWAPHFACQHCTRTLEAILQFYTVAATVVAIQAKMTGYFLCMNYLSQLYTRRNMTDECKWYERMLPTYYTTYCNYKYKKELNVSWYISVDKCGRPRKGNKTNLNQKRVQFLPIEPSRTNLSLLVPPKKVNVYAWCERRNRNKGKKRKQKRKKSGKGRKRRRRCKKSKNRRKSKKGQSRRCRRRHRKSQRRSSRRRKKARGSPTLDQLSGRKELAGE